MRLQYQTYEFGDSDIHVRTLRDKQEYHDPRREAERLGITSANWSLFGVVWETSRVLANLMWARAFNGERILEVGCGIGLASLVLAMREQDITATDRHPEVQSFLAYNTRLNGLGPIRFERSSWQIVITALGEFDLIIGSDLLYDRSNLAPLSAFIDRHAKRTSEIVIVDPDRGLHSQFSREMKTVGFRAAPRERVSADAPAGYKGSLLGYKRSAAA